MAEKITNETVVTSSEMALILGLTIRQVQSLIQDGKLSKISRGKMPLADNVQKYIQLKIKSSSADASGVELRKQVAEAEFKEAKARKALIEAQELEGSMHRSGDVKTLTEDLIFNIRSALMSFPGRVSVDCAAESDAAVVSEILKKEMYKILEDLADYHYDSARYDELVRQRKAWELGDESDE